MAGAARDWGHPMERARGEEAGAAARQAARAPDRVGHDLEHAAFIIAGIAELDRHGDSARIVGVEAGVGVPESEMAAGLVAEDLHLLLDRADRQAESVCRFGEQAVEPLI